MPAKRNPFYVRTAEQAESDEQFLKLFSLTILEFVPLNWSWDRFLPIEGAPGSGKSTLLRLFTPTVLNSVANQRHLPEFGDLVEKLTDIDALDSNGVQLLAILINCSEDYSRIADLELVPSEQLALFWALMRSRLALLLIRAALQLTRHSYPADVDLVLFRPRSDITHRRPDSRTLLGRDLFDRARVVEQSIINALNSFLPRKPCLPEDAFVDDVFQLVNTHEILIGGDPVARHILFMFDDAHSLDDAQRKSLSRELERHDQRAFASWMAMRLRALEPPDLVSDEVRPDRERFKPLRFEASEKTKIDPWLRDVGDRRADRAQRDISSFAGCLADSLETEFQKSTFANAADNERARTQKLAQPHGELFRNWLLRTENEVKNLSEFDQAVQWAQLQILMERRIRKIQREFNFMALPPDQIEHPASDTKEPATFFMSLRNNLPYFFGVDRVMQLASANVEQFLSLAAILFDHLLNSGNVRRRTVRQLPPTVQNRLILAESRTYVREIRTRLPYGEDVANFVTAMAQLCKYETSKPNVPIVPGVTGISIQISERDAMIRSARSSNGPERRLLNALASAIAHNVMSMRVTDRRRDENRAVFYLNRLLCPTFDLPLGFGGYKPQKISELSEWVVSGLPSRQSNLEIGGFT